MTESKALDACRQVDDGLRGEDLASACLGTQSGREVQRAAPEAALHGDLTARPPTMVRRLRYHPTMTSSLLPAGTARLRPKNQLTVPDAALEAVGASVGDRFVVTVEHGGIRLQPVRASYDGALSDVWGPDWEAELRAERDRWSERDPG